MAGGLVAGGFATGGEFSVCVGFVVSVPDGFDPFSVRVGVSPVVSVVVIAPDLIAA